MPVYSVSTKNWLFIHSHFTQLLSNSPLDHQSSFFIGLVRFRGSPTSHCLSEFSDLDSLPVRCRMTLDVLAVEFRDRSAFHIVAARVNTRNKLDSRTVCDSFIEPSSIFTLKYVSVGHLTETEATFIEGLGLWIKDDSQSASAVISDLLGPLSQQANQCLSIYGLF